MTNKKRSDEGGFIHPHEIAGFLKVSRFGSFGNILAKSLMRVTKLQYLNKAYAERAHLPAKEFIDSMFEYLDIDYKIYEKDLKRIPKTGPFITISNHPLGGIDGMILIRTLLDIRPDFKVIANFLLQRVEPLKPYILAVNPFEEHQDVRSSLQGVKEALGHLKDGHPIGIFPAGEVSMQQATGEISDREWLTGAVRIIKKSKVPVVPIYFHGFNSQSFYKISKMGGTLRTAMLPRQMTSQKNREICVRIGNPILVKDIQSYSNDHDLTNFLRDKTYFFQNSILKEERELREEKMTPIRAAIPSEVLQSEIAACKASGKLLFEYNHFEAYRAYERDIPQLLNEIGRQREIAFRAVGEGTNTDCDLDKYDSYYEHLFIYDTKENAIVGAYRIGHGNEIFEQHGVEGFYLSELFEFKPPVYDMLKDSIELGRAFIAKQYQRQAASLFLLWKGIITILIIEKAQFLIGGVSISNNYSELSKSIIIDFIESYHFDHDLAKHVQARNPYKVELTFEQKSLINKAVKGDMKKLDKLIDELELEPGLNLPVLLKKYLKQNAKLFGFNIDPNFNNALDGLMYVSINDIPEEMIRTTLEKFQTNPSGQ